MASNGDENEPLSYGIAVGVSMPAHVYDTLTESLEMLRGYEESNLAGYKLFKGRIPDDRLLPEEVNAQRGLELVEAAQNWLEYTMQGLEPPKRIETGEAGQ